MFVDTGNGIGRFLKTTGPVLCLDIGSGTQDGILALPDEQPENWPRFVLPSPARVIADRIREHTGASQSVWLCGQNMGGGFTDAVREQFAKGLKPQATPSAALALHDNAEYVRSWGIEFSLSCPAGYAPVCLTDYDAPFWQAFLAAAGLPKPSLVVAAAQDHGHHVTGNREGRFQLWRELLLETKGDPSQWLFDEPPSVCTRLAALRNVTGGPVADTGTAAVLGAMAVAEVAERSRRQGITIVNVGNSHVVAFLVFRERVFGVYEQHTARLDLEALLFDLKEFRFGWLPDEQVRSQGGHGCLFTGPLPEEAEGFMPTFILGPQREKLHGHGQFIAPYGDMMFAGCHGLLLGVARRNGF